MLGDGRPGNEASVWLGRALPVVVATCTLPGKALHKAAHSLMAMLKNSLLAALVKLIVV